MWAPIVVRGCIPGAVSRRDTLDAAFDNAIFYHAATTFSTDIFTNVAQSVSYNEPDNVTCVECSWAVHSPWHYPWKRRIAPAPSPPTPSPGTTCTAVNKTANEDIQGNDLPETPTFASTFDACLALCCANPACAALLWEARSDWAGKSCTKGAGCCWLKSAAGNRQPKPASVGAINANIDGRHPTPGGQPTLAEVAAPPLGYRSSPALGGVGAGSTELRSDGSFRDWTIFNQGPAGSGKYGLVDDVYMGVKVGKSAKMLRTLPPRWARNIGVDALTFSGTYPLTRLVANDSAFAATPTTLYAYSTLKPTDLAASAFPALVLTLHVVNPSPTAALNASFMFSLPFGAWTDCARSGVDGIVASAAASPAHCMHACGEASANCSAWEFDDAAALCTLHAEVPHTAHKVGAHCGVRSADGWLRTAKGGLVRSQRPLASGPSMGDITLQPVVVGSSSATTTASVGASDDPAALWRDFAANGRFTQASAPPAVGTDAAHGAVAVSTVIAAGRNATLSIVFSWHFPDRDFNGFTYGNMYQDLWQNSTAVADELATNAKLTAVVRDITTHHRVVASPANPTPVWLKDMLVNQWSHFHMLMWFRDGRLREYEAWSCDDVDSVHNDYQRHLLYLWAFPEFELNKMEAWSSFAQDAKDGHIWESLGYTKTGQAMDVGGGRLMGDTTTLYLIEMYELLLHRGDVAWLREKWPSARRAVVWMIDNAEQGRGLPQFLQTTYDHFGFDKRPMVVYNAHIYLTALYAVGAMADVLGDANMSTWVAAAGKAGAAKLTRAAEDGGPLWNKTKAFFLAHSETNTQVFTDTLYGQMLSHHIANGSFTLPTKYLSSHLAYEWAENVDLYGMRVLSSPIQEDSIWMNGPPTWTYLQLAIGELNASMALEPLRRMSENFRSRINDMWNLRALTHTQTEGTELEHGQPREQGHYAFMLTDLFLLPLLSGQAVNMVEGALTLAPKFDAPYCVPVLIAGCEATLAATSAGRFTIVVAFGELKLAPRGLVASECVYPDAVWLRGGESLEWSC